MRVPLLTAALLVATTATSAHATSCPMIRDLVNDESLGGMVVNSPVNYPPAPALDVVSGDLGFVGDDVVAVMRMRDISLGAGPFLVKYWELRFSSGDEMFHLQAKDGPSGTSFTLFRDTGPGRIFGTPIGSATGTVDTVTDEVRVVAPRTLLDPWLADGAGVVVQIWTTGGRDGVPVAIRMDQSDFATTTVGSPGCLG